MKEYFFTEKNLYYRMNDFNEDRKTIVFVHGVSGSSSAWLPYEKHFENKYNVISFDLRGHGKSIRYKEYENYKIDLFSDDIYDLLKKLEVNKFILVSHSFGSLIALAFSEKHQDMLLGLILISPGASVKNMLSAKIIKPFLYGIIKLLPAPKNVSVGTHINYEKYLNSGDWNIRRTYADVKNTGLRIYLYCTKQTYSFDGEKILDMINIPTLIIHGRKDTIFPIEESVKIHNRIKNSEMLVIENSDHILVLNNFTEVSRFIEDFVKKLD